MRADRWIEPVASAHTRVPSARTLARCVWSDLHHHGTGRQQSLLHHPAEGNARLGALGFGDFDSILAIRTTLAIRMRASAA